MKSITIHDIDNILSEKITEISKRQGLSLDKTIKNILKEALGLTAPDSKGHRDDFIDFFGVWSEKEGEAFETSIQDFEKINSEDWG